MLVFGSVLFGGRKKRDDVFEFLKFLKFFEVF